MYPLLSLLVRKAVPLARWGLVWWPVLLIALYIKKAMIGADNLAMTARTVGKVESFKQGYVDWQASFSFVELLSLFRGELLWGLLLLPAFSLLLTSGRRASRWRGPILGGASILLSCLLYAEYGSIRVVGRMLSLRLATDALTFANCCAPMARQFFGVSGFVQLAAMALLTASLAWWAGRQNRKNETVASRSRVDAAGTLSLWGLALSVLFVSWLPWLPTVRYHTSVFTTALKTLVADETLDTSAYAGLSLEELARRYRELTHSPDPRPSSHWGSAKDCDVLIFVLETAPARCLPIDGDLADCPNLARLRERSFVATQHLSTYPLTSRAIFSVVTSWYPSTLATAFPKRYPDLLYPGLIHSLKKLGYQTATYAPDNYTYKEDDAMYQNLGVERRLYVENEEAQGKYPVPASRETDTQQRLRRDRQCLQTLKEDMHAWSQRGEHFAAMFLPQIAHYPWIDVMDGKDPSDDVIALGHKFITMQDAWLGEILDQLAADGRLEKTLIVVFGDHGTRNKWEAGDFRPGMIEEQSFHVPLLLYAPSALQARTDIGYVTSHIDITPSLLDLLGVRIGRDSEQGTQLWDERIKSRNTYLPANYLLGSDGYYSAEGKYCMWNHPNETVYENTRLYFDTSGLLPKESPRHQAILHHMRNVFALQEVWCSSRCCTTYGDLNIPDPLPNSVD